jgi:hypothetical protein
MAPRLAAFTAILLALSTQRSVLVIAGLFHQPARAGSTSNHPGQGETSQRRAGVAALQLGATEAPASIPVGDSAADESTIGTKSIRRALAETPLAARQEASIPHTVEASNAALQGKYYLPLSVTSVQLVAGAPGGATPFPVSTLTHTEADHSDPTSHASSSQWKIPYPAKSARPDTNKGELEAPLVAAPRSQSPQLSLPFPADAPTASLPGALLASLGSLPTVINRTISALPALAQSQTATTGMQPFALFNATSAGAPISHSSNSAPQASVPRPSATSAGPSTSVTPTVRPQLVPALARMGFLNPGSGSQPPLIANPSFMAPGPKTLQVPGVLAPSAGAILPALFQSMGFFASFHGLFGLAYWLL